MKTVKLQDTTEDRYIIFTAFDDGMIKKATMVYPNKKNDLLSWSESRLSSAIWYFTNHMNFVEISDNQKG